MNINEIVATLEELVVRVNTLESKLAAHTAATNDGNEA